MSSRHIPNLDVLRALGVLLVMSFHARYLAFGWIGVWVFFVLSGFLITRSLIPLASINFVDGLATFYARRSLRIWPAYYLYVLGAGLLIFTGAAHDLTRQFFYAMCYVLNLAPLFGVEAGGRVFSHLWSLAIEEQYYLVIAPIVLLLGRGRCIPLFIACILLSPLLRLLAFGLLQPGYGAPGAAELVKLLTPLQFDSFMLGGLLALREDLVMRVPSRSFLLAAGAILCVVTVALVANHATAITTDAGPAGTDFSAMAQWRLSATSLGIGVDARENMGYVWLYSVLGLASFVLVAVVIRYFGQVRIPVLNAIGRVSYGMYLYHMPLVSGFDRVMQRIAVPKHSVLGLLCFAALVCVTWGVAAVSYRWIEQPFLRLKRRRFEAMPSQPLPSVVSPIRH